MKPRIIVLSADTDESFDWLSDGWHTLKQRHTAAAQTLMAQAEAAIRAAQNVPDAIKRLRAAGFTVTRQKRLSGGVIRGRNSRVTTNLSPK